MSRESNQPLNIGLLVDTSRSQISVVERERKASFTFLDQVLRADDSAFVLHFDIHVELLQGFTSFRAALANAFVTRKIPRRSSTLLFYVRQASEDLMQRQNGRKAFILLTDGGDFGSKASVQTAIEYAQRADTLIYSVLFGSSPLRSFPTAIPLAEIYPEHGRNTMRGAAEEAGGRYFEVSKNESISQVYIEIEDEMRNQYSIAYTPDRRDGSKEYRKISITVADKNLTARTPGYYPK